MRTWAAWGGTAGIAAGGSVVAGVSGGTGALVALVDAVGAGAGVLGFFESADFFTRVGSPYVVMLYNSLIWVEPWPS